MDLVTYYEPKPIPDRRFDWTCYDRDTYDGADDASARARLVGFGRTEDEAIADYTEQLSELDD